ncbi:MAG: pitrilysin family protein, partial [Thermoanaerobacteraceae bacterium]|nr:pitrilysin family protein [Thermoanaerobacteraceae bacterium]
MQFEEIISDNLLNETIYRKKFNNGLDAYVIPKKGFSKCFASLTVKYGSNDSNFITPGYDKPVIVPDGVAHFLEHKMFEKEYGSVFEQFDRLGVSANAYTTNTHTSYYFVSTDNYYEALDVLLEFVQTPYFTDETVEKEKGIIIQELRMYNDDPEREIFNNLLNAMYVEHPVKIDVGGTEESVRSINKDILYLCFNTFYRPDNMIFLSIGDVEPKMVFDYVENRIIPKTTGEIIRIYPEEPDEIKKNYMEKAMNVSIPLMLLGFKDIEKEKNDKSLLNKHIENSIALEALFGRSS